MRRAICAVILVSFTLTGCAHRPAIAHPNIEADDPFIDLMVTYAIHARSLWHDADVGGYWGDGINPDLNQNGAVRGTCNTLATYATLLYVINHGGANAAAPFLRLHQAGVNERAL